jgi:hypothetical protein
MKNMAKTIDWIRVVSWYVMALAMLTAVGSVIGAVYGNLTALGGLVWAGVVGIVGYGATRRAERDRLALVAVLWLYLLTSVVAFCLLLREHLRTGSPQALHGLMTTMLWVGLTGWPLLILHRRDTRTQFTEAN